MAEPHSAAAVAFGARVRRLRKELGLSQDRFAAVAEVDRSYMGQIERGEKNVTLSTILRLARALNVDAGRLVEALI